MKRGTKEFVFKVDRNFIDFSDFCKKVVKEIQMYNNLFYFKKLYELFAKQKSTTNLTKGLK